MRTTVAVLRGGPSHQYDLSLKSGASVLAELDREKYDPRDIFISRAGEWHMHGLAMPPERALQDVDVVFNVIHGQYGEDGRLHRLLDTLGIPYTGADALASSIALNKQHTKELAERLGVRVAHSTVVDAGDVEQTALRLFRTFPHPAVIKPLASGSSAGITIADSYPALIRGLQHAFDHGSQVLVEEYIRGREASVGVIDHFRNERSYALMPVEIVPPQDHRFFSWEVKQGDHSVERVPGNFRPNEKLELMRLARLVHEGLGLQHYSRSDFIVGKRGIYFLEINSAAGVQLHKESLMSKALSAVGAKLSDFYDHVIGLALRRPRQ